MLDKLCQASQSALKTAGDERIRLKSQKIGSEHILLGLVANPESIPSRALLLTNTRPEMLIKETERLIRATTDNIKFANPNSDGDSGLVTYTKNAALTLEQANRYRRYFGASSVHTEHILLAITDEKGTPAAQVFEEVSANLTLLRRQAIRLMAKKAYSLQDAPSLQSALLTGINELIEENLLAAHSLAALYTESRAGTIRLPNHREIVHMVMIGYFADFLIVQMAFQRYLLQEMLDALCIRTGAMDQEITAGIVASTAQTLRQEVRAAIDRLWSHEYSLYRQMLDEAEHDLIGSALEDLWWEQSEELALQKLFDEAMDDHLRKHVLSLQKRRMETDQRLKKMHSRLRDTIQQCFTRHLKSA